MAIKLLLPHRSSRTKLVLALGILLLSEAIVPVVSRSLSPFKENIERTGVHASMFESLLKHSHRWLANANFRATQRPWLQPKRSLEGMGTTMKVNSVPHGATLEGIQTCECWRLDETLEKWQVVSDFFIFLAYFSIPLELLYFMKKLRMLPYTWVILEFVLFIILCGFTHLIAIFCLRQHSYDLAVLQTGMKSLTALVSCATAISLIYIIPELLLVKVREIFLRNKNLQLDRELGISRKQERAGRRMHLLTQKIRMTLDFETIVKTSVDELCELLGLVGCAIWMPVGGTLRLAHHASLRRARSKHKPEEELEIDDSVLDVLTTCHTTVLSSDSTIIGALTSQNPDDRTIAAVRVPVPPGSWTEDLEQSAEAARAALTDAELESVHSSGSGLSPLVSPDSSGSRSTTLTDSSAADNQSWYETNGQPLISPNGQMEPPSYALLVLRLPSRANVRWSDTDMDMVEHVADQIAVALRQAVLLREAQLTRDQLLLQNKELVLARQEAETACRARNDFLAVMNHEMRTPMHAIVALSGLLAETAVTEESKAMLDTIVKSSNLLSTLINDVLDFSRLEAGNFELAKEPFDLWGLFRQVDNLARPMAAKKGLELVLTVATDVPQLVIGDEQRVLQTLLNLVGNACKFTLKGSVAVTVFVERFDNPNDPLEVLLLRESGGHLLALAPPPPDKHPDGTNSAENTVPDRAPPSGPGPPSGRAIASCAPLSISPIQLYQGATAAIQPSSASTQPPAPHVFIRVEVSDTGIGIRKEDINKLFNKFVQADSTTTRNFGGTGLGLAICRKFVNLMSGHIWIESEGLGQGSKVIMVVKMLVRTPTNGTAAPILGSAPTIRTTLPTMTRPGTATKGGVPPNGGPVNVLDGVKALVIDDNSVNRVVTSKLLRRLSCVSTALESGQAALAWLAAGEKCDVVLLDLSMPEMDGFEVCQRIQKAYAPDHRPWIIALTANTDPKTRTRCLEANMDGIVLKPTTAQELAGVLQQLIEERKVLPSSRQGGRRMELRVMVPSPPASPTGTDKRAGRKMYDEAVEQAASRLGALYAPYSAQSRSILRPGAAFSVDSASLPAVPRMAPP